MTLNIGFHQRGSVENVETTDLRGVQRSFGTDQIRKRSEILGYAIDARRQRFPDERAFEYAPHAPETPFTWNDQARSAIRDYQINDLLI